MSTNQLAIEEQRRIRSVRRKSLMKKSRILFRRIERVYAGDVAMARSQNTGLLCATVKEGQLADIRALMIQLKEEG